MKRKKSSNKETKSQHKRPSKETTLGVILWPPAMSTSSSNIIIEDGFCSYLRLGTPSMRAWSWHYLKQAEFGVKGGHSFRTGSYALLEELALCLDQQANKPRVSNQEKGPTPTGSDQSTEALTHRPRTAGTGGRGAASPSGLSKETPAAAAATAMPATAMAKPMEPTAKLAARGEPRNDDSKGNEQRVATATAAKKRKATNPQV